MDHPNPSPSPNPPVNWPQQSWTHLTNVRNHSPLIQCLINFVSMDLMANTLLSAGASPAMVHNLQELPDFTPRVDALCINVGTLSEPWLPAMIAATELANSLGKPWVLDPVAAGASGFRMKACLELVERKPAVIRGNASEVIALWKGGAAGKSGDGSKGVDSSHDSMDAVEAAIFLSQATGAVVAVSGAVDIITDGRHVVGSHSGVPMMQKITATGCSVTALIAAFVAIDPSHVLEATASALSIFGIAGELGMTSATGPASLRMHLIDALYGLDETTVLSRVNITNLSP